MPPKVVVFTDLDGTLLDHHNYSYAAAKPCINYICKHGIPLILTSSKTSVEIEQLCIELNYFHPFIAENGGVLCTPKNYFTKNTETVNEYEKIIIGVSRNDIQIALEQLKPSFHFKSFLEMTAEELISHTGLTRQHVIYANQRDSTEPLLWADDAEKLKDFGYQLKHYNLRLVSGGRFHHVMGIHDKASTMLKLINTFSSYFDHEIISIALGDSPNDLDMLKTATYGIVIPNDDAPKMCIDKHANLRRAIHSGPRGWNDTLLSLLMELNE